MRGDQGLVQRAERLGYVAPMATLNGEQQDMVTLRKERSRDFEYVARRMSSRSRICNEVVARAV